MRAHGDRHIGEQDTSKGGCREDLRHTWASSCGSRSWGGRASVSRAVGVAAPVRGAGGGTHLGIRCARGMCRRGRGPRPRRCLDAGGARGDARHLATGRRRRSVVRRRERARDRVERDDPGLPPPALVRRPADRARQPGAPAQPALRALPGRATAVPGHALVVVALPLGDDPSDEAGDHFTRAMRIARAGELARTVFARDETIARLGRHRVGILCRRDERLGRRVRVLATLLEGSPEDGRGAAVDRGPARHRPLRRIAARRARARLSVARSR